MKINEIVLVTNSITDTIAFYTEVLQLKVTGQTETGVSFGAGSTVLGFREDLVTPDPVYHFAFNIPHNQLAAAMAWLSVRVELLPVNAAGNIAEFSNWRADAVYFKDNNGNLLEFIARHDLDNAREVPFSAEDILCISEIGIAVDSVPAFLEEVVKAHGFDIYAKQAPMEKFAALGDDEGLLIVAETHRNWFPTSIPAGKFPVKVVADGIELFFD